MIKRDHKQFNLILDFDSEYFQNPGYSHVKEFLVRAEPYWPASILGDLLYKIVKFHMPLSLDAFIARMTETMDQRDRVIIVASEAHEVIVFNDWVLVEVPFQFKEIADETWEAVLLSLNDLLEMFRELQSYGQTGSWAGTMQLQGKYRARGPAAKLMFKELSGYWDDRAIERTGKVRDLDNDDDWED